mgnify:FL=1
MYEVCECEMHLAWYCIPVSTRLWRAIDIMKTFLRAFVDDKPIVNDGALWEGSGLFARIGS